MCCLGESETKKIQLVRGDCYSIMASCCNSQLNMPLRFVILAQCKSKQDFLLVCFGKIEYRLGCFAALCFAMLCFTVMWYAVTTSLFISSS